MLCLELLPFEFLFSFHGFVLVGHQGIGLMLLNHLIYFTFDAEFTGKRIHETQVYLLFLLDLVEQSFFNLF